MLVVIESNDVVAHRTDPALGHRTIGSPSMATIVPCLVYINCPQPTAQYGHTPRLDCASRIRACRSIVLGLNGCRLTSEVCQRSYSGVLPAASGKRPSGCFFVIDTPGKKQPSQVVEKVFTACFAAVISHKRDRTSGRNALWAGR